MATTGAVLYARPYAVTATSAARVTGAVCFVQSRLIAGVYTLGVSSTARVNSAALMPSSQHPLGKMRPDGYVQIDPAWDRFFRYQWETRLGGISGQSLPDVVTTVTATQETAAQSAAEVSAIGQQTQANAESLSVVVQVAQNNALTGADQIPPVRLSPGESVP